MKSGASHDDSANLRSFRQGDSLRRCDGHDEDACVVVWAWRDWLWLDPIDYPYTAPFTGRADDYELISRAS